MNQQISNINTTMSAENEVLAYELNQMRTDLIELENECEKTRQKMLIRKLENAFNHVKKHAYKLRVIEQNEQFHTGTSTVSPLNWWREIKTNIDREFGTEPIPNLQWIEIPVYSKMVLPIEHPESDDYHENGSIDQHFLNQLVRIPNENQYPTAKKLIQLALNIGQGHANGTVKENWQIYNFVKSR